MCSGICDIDAVFCTRIVVAFTDFHNAAEDCRQNLIVAFPALTKCCIVTQDVQHMVFAICVVVLTFTNCNNIAAWDYSKMDEYDVWSHGDVHGMPYCCMLLSSCM